MVESRDIVIIGGGPGGYLAALRLAQLGRQATLVEESWLGGTCINVGCIPTKYLLHQTRTFHEAKTNKNFAGAVDQLFLDWNKVQRGRKYTIDRLVAGLNFLLTKNKVEIVRAKASLLGSKSIHVKGENIEITYKAEKIIVATGSETAYLPFLTPDKKTILTSTEALEISSIPKSLLIVGAGAVGLELGSIFQRAGSDVTVLEIMSQILPGTDQESASRLERTLKKQGLKIFTSMRIEKAIEENGQLVLRGTDLASNKEFSFRAEKVLLAAGRRPATASLFTGSFNLDTDKAGFIKVDHFLETSEPGIYAIGDVIGGKLLAHKAYYDAHCVASNVSGLKKRKADYSALPMAVFTDPEYASVGVSQEEAEKEHGSKVKIGIFPLQASGRALTIDATEGMAKLIADESERVIGAHVISPAASELIPVLTMAVARKMTLNDVASIIYVHPSLSESIGEAALKARHEALHILNI